MNKLQAVFWDVDGTIADTELCGHRVAFNLAFKDYDLDWYWDEQKYLELLTVSGGLKRIIHYRDLIQSNMSHEECSKIQERKRHHYSEIILSGKICCRDGVLRLMDELASNDVDQLIVTTSGRESLEPLLKNALNTRLNYFSKIITYEDVSYHKPHPDAYNLAIKFSNKYPSNSLAIEDSISGVNAAKAAKLNCLLTLPPWSSVDQKYSKNANACVDSLGDQNKPSNLIYGRPLITNNIDFIYLSNIIN